MKDLSIMKAKCRQETGCCIMILLFLMLIPYTLQADEYLKKYPNKKLPDKKLISNSIDSRIVEFTTEASYINKSKTNIKKAAHYFTMPPDDLDYQLILDIKTNCINDYKIKKHKNNVDRYMKLYFSIKPGETKTVWIKYLLLLVPLDYNNIINANKTGYNYPEDVKKYLLPSRHIESDDKVIRKITDKFKDITKDPVKLSKLAYEFPSENIKFKVQKRSLGAKKAIISKVGDCTEFSSVFCALTRSCGLPARQYAVFTLGKHAERRWRFPNHVAAEIFLLESAGCQLTQISALANIKIKTVTGKQQIILFI